MTNSDGGTESASFLQAPRNLLGSVRVHVAKRHGLSDVALAKMNRKHDVSVPPRGYWAHIAVGHFDEPTSLPELLTVAHALERPGCCSSPVIT